MKKIEVGSTVTLFKKVNLGTTPDLWRVLAINDDNTYTIAYIRKDGKVNQRRAARNISIDDIEYVLNDGEELEPIRDDQAPLLQMVTIDDKTPGQTGRKKKVPSWQRDVPAALSPYVRDDITLPELLTTAQALILNSDSDEEKQELKGYIKKNRRFIRKPIFTW